MVSQAEPSSPSAGKRRISHRRKQIILQIVVGVIILFCGVVIGSGAALLQLKDKVVIPGPRPPLDAVVRDIRGRYDLTPAQVEKVENVFGERRKTLQAMFEEFRQKSEAEFQKLSEGMKEILSPEQYERWENDFRSRRGPSWRGHGPGRPGPGSPGERGPGERRPGERGPGRRGPGPWRPGSGGPGQREPGQKRLAPGDPVPEELAPGDAEREEPNSPPE